MKIKVTVIALLAVVMGIMVSPSRGPVPLLWGASSCYAGEVAFVDISGVISQSTPGKAGQKYTNDFRTKLQSEYDKYAQTEKDKGKLEIRAEADVSKEILGLLNKEKINFAK